MQFNPHAGHIEGRLTPQQCFDAALFGVRQQGALATGPGGPGAGECLYTYQSPGGRALHCGIGHCLTPSMLEQLIKAGCNDEYDAESVAEEFPDRFPAESRRDLQKFLGNIPPELAVPKPFVQNLQSAHDSSHSLLDFEGHMQQLAAIYDLTYTPPASVGSQA